ncbi:MAG: hypothetical protein H0X25_12145 [Acidobacteriales bacterium]|nr:hypothetical protein [Terriglobales bacterium]
MSRPNAAGRTLACRLRWNLAAIAVGLLITSLAAAQGPLLSRTEFSYEDTLLHTRPQLTSDAVGFPFASSPRAEDLELSPAGELGVQPSPLLPSGFRLSGSDVLDVDSDDSDPVPLHPKSIIVQPRADEASEGKVQWRGLLKTSFVYLGIMHSFRLATEKGTRDPLVNQPFFSGYAAALGNLHGWSDGDGYYENYLGHPLEGAASAYLWIHYDTKYRNVRFGLNRDYWMSRLRAYAFAWAYSEQFEIGPLSEASIGQIQRKCCAYGFVDHVITPNMGIAVTILSDIGDRYIVERVERSTDKFGWRAAARMGLNPAESFVNLISFQYPWRRENRSDPLRHGGEIVHYYRETQPRAYENVERPGIPPFQITATLPAVLHFPNLDCIGGGGVGAFRMSAISQWTIEVSGCTLGNSLPTNWSGDSLTFTTGPQWVWNARGRWNPYFHVRFGG